MNYTEIEQLLESSKEEFLEIKNTYKNTEPDEILDNFKLKLRIKTFLENIQSTLDYFSYSIFNLYIKDTDYFTNLTPGKKEQVLSHIYFPNFSDRKKFVNRIKKMFHTPESINSDIIDLIEKYQSYHGNLWLKDLHNLVNTNKHRYLSLQSFENTEYITNATINGTSNSIELQGITISNCKKTVVLEDGSTIEQYAKTHPENVEYYWDFKFLKNNKNVLDTLENILKTTTSFILESKKIING